MITATNLPVVNNWLKNQTSKPKTMFDLIKNLEPKERAIIYQALDKMQSESEIMLADSHDSNNNHAQRLPLDWLVKNTKAIKQKLFGEQFPEDLEPLTYFLKEYNSTGEIAKA